MGMQAQCYVEAEELVIYQEADTFKELPQLSISMNEEMGSLYKEPYMGTCQIAYRASTINCKWVFKQNEGTTGVQSTSSGQGFYLQGGNCLY